MCSLHGALHTTYLYLTDIHTLERTVVECIDESIQNKPDICCFTFSPEVVVQDVLGAARNRCGR